MDRGVRLSLLVVLIGLILTVLSVSDTYALMFRHEELLDKTYKEFEKGEMISGKIDYVVGRVETGEMKKTIYGIPYSKAESVYYLIVLNGGYVVIESDEGISKLDEIYDATQDMLAGKITEMPVSAYEIETKAVEVTSDEEAMLDTYFLSKGDPSDPEMISGENWQASMYVLHETSYAKIIVQISVALGIFVIGCVMLYIFNKRKPIEGETVYVNEFPDLPDSSEKDSAGEGFAVLSEEGELIEKPEEAEEITEQ